MSVTLTDDLIARLHDRGVTTLLRKGATLPDNCVFEPPCSLKWMSVQHSRHLGAFSYAVSGFYFGCRIGRYCSFGEQVQIGRHAHSMHWASTSPFFYTRFSDVLDQDLPRGISLTLWGALVAAVLAESSKWAFGLYVSHALPYLKLYGALGLIPLFLFWLYLGWLIILFGLEIAFTLQAMKGRVFERKDARGALTAADPQWLLPTLAAIGRSAVSGRPVSRQDLAEELDLRLEAVAELAARLEAEGLVHQVTRRGTEDVGLTLALPPDRIPLARLAELASRSTLGARPLTGPGWDALAAIHDQARAAAGDKTLADVLVKPVSG